MSRSVQCQQCGQWGHNRRGCPRIKEAYAKVERLAEKYGIERSEDERAYASTSWIERINEAVQSSEPFPEEDVVEWRERWHWEEIESRQIAQRAKNKRGRKCGFCDESGHNARTCPAKKQHRKDCDAMRGLAHRVLAACLKKAGIVPGALMRKRDWDYRTSDYQQVVCMVTGIEWERVALVSPESGGVYLYGPHVQEGQRLVDQDLQPEIDRLINQVSQWREY